MRIYVLSLGLALVSTGCGGGSHERVSAPSSARGVSRPTVRIGVCSRSTGAVRRVSLAAQCWKITGSSVLVAGPRPHLSLRGGCVATSAASVRLPIHRAGRWRLSWQHRGGSITGACRSSVVAVVFLSGPGGKLVLSMTPLAAKRADLDVRPRRGDKVVLQFWMRGGRTCGGTVQIRDIALTRAPAAGAPQTRPRRRPLARLTKDRIVLGAKIYFAPHKATILNRSFAVLNQVVELLKDRPNIRIEVRAHLGAEPKNYYGRRPSQRRATAVRRYLMAKGIDGRRIRARGYGGTQPLNRARTAQERAINRRVEFIVYRERR